MRGKKAKLLRKVARMSMKDNKETVYTDVPQHCQRPDADGKLQTVVIHRTQMMKCQRALYKTLKKHVKQQMHG